MKASSRNPPSPRTCRDRELPCEGTVTHADDKGNFGKTHAGDVEVMSAGTGIRHSEQNEEDVPIRLFQIWFRPSAAGGIPRWGSKPFPKADRAGVFVPLASGRNAEGALPICADAEVYRALLRAGGRATYSFRKGDVGYLAPATGEVEVNGVQLQAGEAVVIENEETIAIKAHADSELVLVITSV
jgi:redox-sensitive bicupin YhaK (pirin superfamily)